LSAQIDSLKEKTKAHRQIIQQADADLEALVPDTRNANAKHEEAVQRGRSKESDIQADKDRLSETVNKFGLVENDIDEYIANGGSRNLEICQRAIKDIEQNQKRIDGEMSKVQKWANELRQRVDDSERTKRSIDENIRFRGYERDLKKYQQLIGDLEKRNVQGEFDRLSNEAVKAEREYQELHAIRGPLMGTASQLDKQLADYIKEWNTEYQDAAHKYREGHIKVETTKAAIEDIDKYRQGLEHAIMQYHSIKMEEINRIISEIWTNTYRGSDIDAIMVKSENDAADKSNDRRSYNYRVVMVKDGEEMDMRGRCSAGQKVLASIIIRLALAECFGVGCGVRTSQQLCYGGYF
jgi:DNA repair protein RAD50